VGEIKGYYFFRKVQNDTGAHPHSCSSGKGNYFKGWKVAGTADNSPSSDAAITHEWSNNSYCLMYLRGMHKASAEILCCKSAVGMKSWKLYSQANILVSKGMLLKTSDIEIYLSLSHGTQKLGLSFWCLFVLCLMKFCRFAPRIEQFERIVMHNPSTSLYTRKGKFYTHKSTLQYLQKWELYTIIKPFPYEGKSLNNMNFIVLFFTRVLIEIACVLFLAIVPLLRNTLGPPVHKLVDALQKKSFWLDL